MTTVRITYYGMDGSGRNVTEAKRDAGRKIEEALTGPYAPEIFSHRGYAMLVYREPSGWHCHTIADPSGIREGKVWGGSRGEGASRAVIVQDSLNHLAQCGWEPTDGLEPPAFLTDRASIADFKSWAEIQLRYRAATAAGLSSNDAHSYACRNPQRPDLAVLPTKESA